MSEDLGVIFAALFAIVVIVIHKIAERRALQWEAAFWQHMDEVRSLRKNGTVSTVEFGLHTVRQVRHTDPYIRLVR